MIHWWPCLPEITGLSRQTFFFEVVTPFPRHSFGNMSSVDGEQGSGIEHSKISHLNSSNLSRSEKALLCDFASTDSSVGLNEHNKNVKTTRSNPLMLQYRNIFLRSYGNETRVKKKVIFIKIFLRSHPHNTFPA